MSEDEFWRWEQFSDDELREIVHALRNAEGGDLDREMADRLWHQAHHTLTMRNPDDPDA
jgi:predicted Fe-S protein YdhL (DUF1289 family)